MASQQLSQITSGGFDPQNLSKNFWALIQTNNKSPQNVPNHLHVISPSHRNCENQLKEKNFEEIQNFQNQNKLPVETNENLPANSMCLSHLNLNSRLPNNEMSKSLDGSVGLEKGYKLNNIIIRKKSVSLL